VGDETITTSKLWERVRSGVEARVKATPLWAFFRARTTSTLCWNNPSRTTIFHAVISCHTLLCTILFSTPLIPLLSSTHKLKFPLSGSSSKLTRCSGLQNLHLHGGMVLQTRTIPSDRLQDNQEDLVAIPEQIRTLKLLLRYRPAAEHEVTPRPVSQR